MTTPRDLIKASLELLGVIDPIEDVDSDEISGLFSRLNRMISAWSTQSALIFADTEVTKALTANDGEYTIGSGGDINTSKPIGIKTAFIRDGDIDHELEIIDEHRYAEIAYKSAAGDIPQYLYYKTGHPLGTIRLWPLPGSAYTLYLYVNAPLTAFTGLSQKISLPEGYEEAIEYNFAKRIGGIYGKSLTIEQAQIADEGLANIKRVNKNTDKWLSSTSFPGQSSDGFDIYSRRNY